MMDVTMYFRDGTSHTHAERTIAAYPESCVWRVEVVP